MVFSRPRSKLSDVVSYAIYCADDSTAMLVLENNTKTYWIPSSNVSANLSWNSQFSQDMHDILGPGFEVAAAVRLYRIWAPKHVTPYIFHGVFAVYITAEKKVRLDSIHGKYQGAALWVRKEELTKMCSEHKLLSPEVLEFVALVRGEKNIDTDSRERIRCGILTEITNKSLVTSSVTSHEQLLDAAGFSAEIQTSIYREFIMRCFPALYMCKQLFIEMFFGMGWSPHNAANLFKIADLCTVGGLAFREFLYIVAATEPSITHSGVVAEIRCRYIFKFFDSDNDGQLNYEEFTNLVSSIRKSRSQPTDSASVNQEAESLYKSMGHVREVESLTLNDFLSAVGSSKLRGTSQVLRSPMSIITYLLKLKEKETVKTFKFPDKMMTAVESKHGLLSVPPRVPTVVPKTPKFELCMHTVKVAQDGATVSVDQIHESLLNKEKVDDRQTESSKRLSADVFDQKSIPNQVLAGLRYLIGINKGKSLVIEAKCIRVDAYNWGQFNPGYLAQHLIVVCKIAREIFMKEPRLIELKSPAYIMGDLHGNVQDLLCFENAFWSLGPPLCSSSLLFLGDYVDRGYYGMEVLTYLFCYKVMAPKKVFLVRGNHEHRDIQKMFGFQEELNQKFSDKVGLNLWEAINDVLDTLPVAAVVDSRIFCCHGGIPAPWLCPAASAINSVPVPLSKPDTCSIAWELMWNDPLKLKGKQIPQRTVMELLAQDGFAANERRGTGHVFTTEALENFLSINGYSHLVRSHEYAQAGFNVQQKGKLVTVFSSSRYCGNFNSAASVLVDQGKLRILRIEVADDEQH